MPDTNTSNSLNLLAKKSTTNLLFLTTMTNIVINHKFLTNIRQATCLKDEVLKFQ
jgi:hypothetical protein